MGLLASINDNQRTACLLRVKGRNNRAIAAELGVTKHTVDKWFLRADVKRECERLRKRVEDEAVREMAMGEMGGRERALKYIEENAYDLAKRLVDISTQPNKSTSTVVAAITQALKMLGMGQDTAPSIHISGEGMKALIEMAIARGHTLEDPKRLPVIDVEAVPA